MQVKAYRGKNPRKRYSQEERAAWSKGKALELKLLAAKGKLDGVEALVVDHENGSSAKSVHNLVLLYMQDCPSLDARGYKQWQEAGRRVRKGAKAVYILKPSVKRVGLGTELEDEKLFFRNIPVFRFEDTEPMGREDEHAQPDKFQDWEIPEVADLWDQWKEERANAEPVRA